MSSCVIIHNKNNLIFASDTALSTYVDGAFYRIDSNYHKVLPYNEGWYFCSGTASTIELIRNRISEYGFDDIETWLRINSKPSVNGIYDIELIQIDKNTNVVYQYSQYNNFKCVMHVPPICGFNIITSGYKTKDLYSLVINGMHNSLDISQVIVDSYSKICDECVGGSIDLNINGHTETIQLIENVKYTTKAIIKLNVITDFVESGHIGGSTIVGSRIGIGQFNDGHYCFEVDTDGNMIAKQGFFKDGTLESSTITAPTITNGTSFYVDKDGMICTNAKIGGWSFIEDKIYSNNLSINSNGSMDGSNWNINSAGEANFRYCNLFIPKSKSYVNGQLLENYIDNLVTGNIWVKDTTKAQEVSAGEIRGQYGDFNTVISTKLTATSAKSLSTKILQNLVADYISTSTLDAKYITAGTIDVSKLTRIYNTYLSSSDINSIWRASFENNSKVYATNVNTTDIYCGRYAFELSYVEAASGVDFYSTQRGILIATRIN